MGAPMSDVVRLARQQGGVVLRKQLRALGFTWQRISTARSRKLLTRHLGVLSVRHGVPDWAATRSPQFRSALHNAHAMQLKLGPTTIITGPTAALLRGLEGKGRDADWATRLAFDALAAYGPPNRHPTTPGFKAIRATFTGQAESIHGVQVADGVTALIDTLDLVRRRSKSRFIQLLDLALQLRWLTLMEIQQRLSRRTARNGPRATSRRLTKTLRMALRHASRGTHSEAERRLAGLLRERGMRRGGRRGWRANHEVDLPGGGGVPRKYRIDFAWEHQRVAVEVDGRAYHSSAEAFERDRVRISDLAAAGWTVLTFTWDAIVNRKEWVIARVEDALARAPRESEPS